MPKTLRTALYTPLLTTLVLTACSGDPAPVDVEGAAFTRVSSLEEEDMVGIWSSQGGSCTQPDFTILRDASTDRQGLAVTGEFNGWERTGRLNMEEAEMRFVDPRRELPVRIEDGGLHVGPPSDGLAVLGSRNIFAEGVIFRKCAE